MADTKVSAMTNASALSGGEEVHGVQSAADVAISMTQIKTFVGAANLRSLWLPAGFVQPSTTGGCAAVATVATSANQPDIRFLAFDATTAEYAQCPIRMPKNWDEGTVTAKFIWSHPSTTTNFGVRWGIQGVAGGNGEAIAAAFGTAQEVTDTGGTTDVRYVSDATSAVTIAGTPAADDVVTFRIYRDPANGGDNMAVDARLEGVVLFYNTNTLDET